MIVLVALALDQSKNHLFKYVLFFSITITSAFGLTKTLTGSHAESGTIILYGFSFYTASIAYLLHSKRLSVKSIAVVSNPLLLITGPIDVLPDLPSFIGRVCSGYAPVWGELQTPLV
jgi:hypothetical protein